MKKIVSLTSVLMTLFLMAGVWFTQPIHAQDNASLPVMTTEQLAVNNGQNGAKTYFAYKGLVYDVSSSTLWKLGEHFGLHAGVDLTGKMGDAPHGDEVLKGFPVVARYGTSEGVAVEATVSAVTAKPDATTSAGIAVTPTSPWYAGRIRILGFSILGWTGILLGVFFVLNFATCFALPWSKISLPWRGSRPGPDPLDTVPTHQKWAAIHKYFAWIVVIFGIVHGLLGFLQMFFGQYL